MHEDLFYKAVRPDSWAQVIVHYYAFGIYPAGFVYLYLTRHAPYIRAVSHSGLANIAM